MTSRQRIIVTSGVLLLCASVCTIAYVWHKKVESQRPIGPHGIPSAALDATLHSAINSVAYMPGPSESAAAAAQSVAIYTLSSDNSSLSQRLLAFRILTYTRVRDEDVALIVPSLSAETATERAAAARSLASRWGDSNFMPEHYERLINDVDPLVRVAVINSLWNYDCDDVRIKMILSRADTDPDPIVRAMAATWKERAPQ